MEQFANNAETTLNGAINNSVTSITVISASGFPGSEQYRIRIDDELMLVTAVAGLSWTVTRGAEGTVAASHNDGSRIRLIVTKGALDQLRIDNSYSNAIVSRYTPGVEGRLFFPTDFNVIQRDNGTSWDSFGPIPRLKKPASTGWTWLNQDSAVVTSTAIGELITRTNATSGINIRYRSLLNGASFTLIVGWLGYFSQEYSSAQIILRNSSNSHLLSWGIGLNGGSQVIYGARFSDPFTFVNMFRPALGQLPTILGGDLYLLKITFNGTDYKFYHTKDGYHWFLYATEPAVAHLGTADQVGFGIDSSGATNFGTSNHLLHWDEF